MTDFLTLAYERYSCREFTDQVDALLEAARVAPTACNKQPWHAWVVTDPEALARLNATTRFGFGAKVVIVLGAARDEAWTRKYDGANFADVDASIVGTHIMLAALGYPSPDYAPASGHLASKGIDELVDRI